MVPAHDPKSVSARLAKIEKGKGPSAQNPLLGLGQSGHFVVLLAGVILVAHVLELPLAFRVLKPRNPAPLRVLLGTFLFGFTWWLPAKRGIYPVR